MLIVISGRPGAGKTTLAKHIAERYKLRYISAGEMFREISKQHGFEPRGKPFLDFHERLERDKALSRKIDKEIDQKIIRKAKLGNVVVEGWLAAHLIKHADLKVFLNISPETAARRIAEREASNAKPELQITKRREHSFARRARIEYSIDINDVSNFDIVLNTERFSPDETMLIIDTVLDILR
jgi:cytidylate kinase